MLCACHHTLIQYIRYTTQAYSSMIRTFSFIPLTFIQWHCIGMPINPNILYLELKILTNQTTTHTPTFLRNSTIIPSPYPPVSLYLMQSVHHSHLAYLHDINILHVPHLTKLTVHQNNSLPVTAFHLFPSLMLPFFLLFSSNYSYPFKSFSYSP